MSCVLSTAPRFLVASVIAIGLLVPAPGISQAASGNLSGRVLHSETGLGIPGVHVRVLDLGVGVLTDDLGEYAFVDLAPGEHEFGFYLVGCRLAVRTFGIAPAGQHREDVVVGDPGMEVRGLTVSGLSSELPPSDRPYSAGVVEESEMRPGVARGLADLIRGRVPGARIVQGSGEPGSAPSIQLRGPTSIQGVQDALIVVDGVPAGRQLTEIDPMDVEHIEVLKGAVASATYGSRGQAGVIEITTKRGVRPSPPPVLLVDGERHEGTLSSVPPESIARVDVLDEALARLVMGPTAEGGVIHVTTVGGTTTPTASQPSYCRLLDRRQH